MKLRIELAKCNGGKGSFARIETKEDWLTLAGGATTTPARACLSAAKTLRDAATRFEMLALEDAPYRQETHRKINAAMLKTPNAKVSGPEAALSPEGRARLPGWQAEER